MTEPHHAPRTAALRIAIVWNHDSNLANCSFRFEQYYEGFRALGHEPVLVCWEGKDHDFAVPAKTFPPDQFASAELWRSLGVDVAVMVTWHRMSNVLAAMKEAGLATIAISDSDGQVGIRVFPRATFERFWPYQVGPIAKLRGLKYWIDKYRGNGMGENQEHLASTEHSDVVVLGSSLAKDNFARFLHHQHSEHLAAKLTYAPFAVGASFLAWPVPEEKPDRITAIGRWGDPQKNAGLLVGAIDRFCALRRSTEIVILGSGGKEWFSPLRRRYSQVEYRGEVDQEHVAKVLANSRSIVFSSRWEGSPHAAKEALATGATILGTPIPSLESWSENERFGRTASKHEPQSLAEAMLAEMDCWDRGDRDSTAIANEWRSRLEPENVCRKLLDDLSAARTGPSTS